MRSSGPKKSHFRREVQRVWRGVLAQGLGLKGPTEAQIQKFLHPQRKGAGPTTILVRGLQAGPIDRAGQLEERNSRKHNEKMAATA